MVDIDLVEKTAKFLAEQMKWYERYDNLSPEMKEYYKERAAKIIEFVKNELAK